MCTWRGACASRATDIATIKYAKHCKVRPLSIKERRPKRSIIQKHMPDEIMYEVALPSAMMNWETPSTTRQNSMQVKIMM